MSVAAPDTDRQYAYFRAIGVSDTSNISKILNLHPDELYNVGDLYKHRDQDRIRRRSIWKLNSNLTETERLEDHIHSLLMKLAPRRNALLNLSTQFQLQIVVVSFNLQSFSFELPFEQQRLATELGICFWFDTYSFGDVHDELMALREDSPT